MKEAFKRKPISCDTCMPSGQTIIQLASVLLSIQTFYFNVVQYTIVQYTIHYNILYTIIYYTL